MDSRNLPSSIFEATIPELSAALSARTTTSVELVSKYLHRIATYDTRGPQLNSIPIINPEVFNEAAASDQRRATGQARGSLEGIPFTVKESYKVKGMTCTNGSPAFRDLIANEDAFAVEKLREAGAVLIGRTNMPPMAYGGMQRGVHGRPESPYNVDYIPAAFASGSSNGSGVSTAANFAAFGLGGETVSSGRSPASNNGLVCYTPSKGAISGRGTWPLYPTCDVVITHTKSLVDLFSIMEALAQNDDITKGDFWREQAFIPVPDAWEDLGNGSIPCSFNELRLQRSPDLKGKRVAVPALYVGELTRETPESPYTSPEVKTLWAQARADLETLGAEVVVVQSFPAVELYEAQIAGTPLPPDTLESTLLPKEWNSLERGTLVADAWEDFLRSNQDPSISSLVDLDPSRIWPLLNTSHDDPQLRFHPPANSIHWRRLSEYISNRGDRSIYETPNLDNAVKALEAMRIVYFDQWLTSNNFDLVVFPAIGDIGRADADVSPESAEHAWRNGVKYSNGNRAFRHLGIPSVTVPMGLMEEKRMPVGLTFLAKAYDDLQLMQYALTYEMTTGRRVSPPLTPALESDKLPREAAHDAKFAPTTIYETECIARTTQNDGDGSSISLSISGFVSLPTSQNQLSSGPVPFVEIFIDGKPVGRSAIQLQKAEGSSVLQQHSFRCDLAIPKPATVTRKHPMDGPVAADNIMVVVLARSGPAARPDGWISLVSPT